LDEDATMPVQVFQTSYEKYGTQKITVTISSTKIYSLHGRLHKIVTKTKIPTHPQNNSERKHEFYLSETGVPRWTSNRRVPPSDTVKELFIDRTPGFNRANTTKERDEETSAFLADYRRRMANHVPSGEELSEMRAAFGTGTTVVNIITGQKTLL
jgi:hypothetical protein